MGNSIKLSAIHVFIFIIENKQQNCINTIFDSTSTKKILAPYWEAKSLEKIKKKYISAYYIT